ncbi:hypothetical protein CEXT_610521 [Caerostris extrusa]|uniref:Uncharacterized protein n=1 Tax=Caerostris extrusa TaxID=172846 RepID=A0AAV4P750_CAEEX|nr:hypothetical protein CEXT_610521 [Caerostris extrusa]
MFRVSKGHHKELAAINLVSKYGARIFVYSTIFKVTAFHLCVVLKKDLTPRDDERLSAIDARRSFIIFIESTHVQNTALLITR